MINEITASIKFNSLNRIFVKNADENGRISIQTLYDLIKNDINSIFKLYQPYLKHVMEYPKGQINLESYFGREIQEILSSNNLALLEFGCWNGMGSTKLATESTCSSIISVELNPFMVSTAVKNLQPFPNNLKLIWGKILETNNFLIDLNESFLSNEFKNLNTYLGALVEVILLHSAPNILKLLPNTIDCILLDGGGFMTFEEFLILKDRADKYLFLDDINSVKCSRIFLELSNSSEWSLKSKYSDRASAIFERTPFSR